MVSTLKKMKLNILSTVISMLIIIKKVQLQMMDMDPVILKNKLEDYVLYSLKQRAMQDYLNSLTFQQNVFSSGVLSTLVNTLEIEFQKRIDAVKRLRQAVEESYTGTESSSHHIRCCDIMKSYLTYDSMFKYEVTRSAACDYVAPSSVSSPRRLSASAFYRASKQNLLDIPSLKWQYFGSNEGVTTIYPARGSDACESLDGRLKPWFLEAYVPSHKHFVIVIDSSGSMSELYNGVVTMELVRGIAKSLIEILNPYDKFAVMAISDKQETLTDYISFGDCFSYSLALATEHNIKQAITFIDSIPPTGGTYYSRGLEEAFRFYKDSTSVNAGDSNQKILHFISDGMPNDSPKEILEMLKRKNAEMKNTVKVMTYGVGEADFSLLESMAKLNPIDSKKGVFTAVPMLDMFPDQIASNFKLFGGVNELITEPIWLLPYLHKKGIGHATTASLPVYRNGEAIGVVAIDILLKDLFREVTHFRKNEFTYAFVVDDMGIIHNHPLWPYKSDHECHHIYATVVETDKRFLPILDSMLKGESGTRRLISQKVITQGNSRRYGVQAIKVLATYQWTKIPNTKYSVCIVYSGNDYGVLTPQKPLRNGTFLHHRFDLIPPKHFCQQTGVLAAKGKSAVFLTDRAYTEEYYSYTHQFTRSDIEKITDYVEGRTEDSSHLKEGIKEEIIATQYAEHLWTEVDENSGLQKDVVWRYLATANGVFRGYPGFQLPNGYDPTIRSWYELALAHRQKTTAISSPYIDIASQTGTITLSRVLFKRKPSSIHELYGEKVFGVMGVDILISHFNRLFLSAYKKCLDVAMYRCLLVDVGGYVIISNEVAINYESLMKFHRDHNWETHITEIEPEISSVLIRDNILRRSNCSKIVSVSFQRAYSISENQEKYEGSYLKNAFDIFGFKLIPVPDTNVFLILRMLSNDPGGCNTEFFRCPCAPKNRNVHRYCITEGNEEGNCECPCASANPYFNPCLNDYVQHSDLVLPCIPEMEHVQLTPKQAIDRVSADAYPKCYSVLFRYSEIQGEEESSLQLLIPASITGGLLFLAVLTLIYQFPRITAKLEKTYEVYDPRKSKSALSDVASVNTDSTCSRDSQFGLKNEHQYHENLHHMSVDHVTGSAASHERDSANIQNAFNPLGEELSKQSFTIAGKVTTSLSGTTRRQNGAPDERFSRTRTSEPSSPRSDAVKSTLPMKKNLPSAPILQAKDVETQREATKSLLVSTETGEVISAPTHQTEFASQDCLESSGTETADSTSDGRDPSHFNLQEWSMMTMNLSQGNSSLPGAQWFLNIGTKNASIPADVITSALERVNSSISGESVEVAEPQSQSTILGRSSTSVVDSSSGGFSARLPRPNVSQQNTNTRGTLVRQSALVLDEDEEENVTSNDIRSTYLQKVASTSPKTTNKRKYSEPLEKRADSRHTKHKSLPEYELTDEQYNRDLSMPVEKIQPNRVEPKPTRAESGEISSLGGVYVDDHPSTSSGRASERYRNLRESGSHTAKRSLGDLELSRRSSASEQTNSKTSALSEDKNFNTNSEDSRKSFSLT